MKISTVISFSSLETRFLPALIREVERFCDDIIIVGYDHFFNGDKENVEIMKEFAIHFPNTRWIIIPWSSDMDSKFCHNNARWVGAESAKNSRVLFLDADEIPDGYLMKRWLEHEDIENYLIHVFSCYWYFREPTYQAKTTEFCALLAYMPQLTKEMFFTPSERWFCTNYPLKSKVMCTLNNNVMFHHYSWVRTKDEMLTKVKSWGHKNDRDWVYNIEEEFKNGFSGKDFVHGYSYNTVLNVFNIYL